MIGLFNCNLLAIISLLSYAGGTVEIASMFLIGAAICGSLYGLEATIKEKKTLK